MSASVADAKMLISVADRGPGIPPADIERIFDKFYRVTRGQRDTTRTMGTGLGLAVCRGLVEAHGGHIWAENRPDLRLMESAVAGGVEESESTTITLRMDPRMLARIERLARSRYLNYQSMIKQWMSERMEQEVRER